MKKILITQRLCSYEEYNETYDRLDTQWAKLLQKADLLPLLVPSGFDVKLFLAENAIDGVLFTGGNSLACIQENELSVKRDVMEKEILEYSLANAIPVMGVCRGMQFIAHYFGASLVPVKNHTAVNHDYVPSETTRYSNYFSRCHKVNSYHDFAVVDMKKPLSVSVKSCDGIIEAFEHNSKNIIGFMWHPERETPFLDIDITFFNSFYNA